MSGEHIDFTQLQILDMEGALVQVERIDPWFREDNPCESCGQVPAEWKLTSQWDVHGQCSITECQSCMVEQFNDPTYPDTYNFVA